MLELPEEIKDLIIYFVLDYKTYFSILQTCQELRKIALRYEKLNEKDFLKTYDHENVKYTYYLIGHKHFKEGVYREYDLEDKLKKEIMYHRNKRDGFYREYYADLGGDFARNDLYKQIMFKDDLAEGIYEELLYGGHPWIRCPMKKGLKHGILEKRSFRNGRVIHRIKYENDLKDGLEEEFDDNGNLIERKYHKKGKEIISCTIL